MLDMALAKEGIEAEIVFGEGIFVDSLTRELGSYGAGVAIGYVAGLQKALEACSSHAQIPTPARGSG